MAEVPSLQPYLHNPEAGQTVDTSPEALGLDTDHNVTDSPPPSQQSKRVKRVVEMTASKLGISSGARSPPRSPPATSPSRLLSLTRKGKGKERQSTDSPSTSSRSPQPSRPTSPVQRTASRPVAAQDDSPFIRPPSPLPSRPLLQSFRGDGSVRRSCL
ncbi:hypothetical protein PLICRDRAFT_409906 [Plicaturopsis crispa FD-325 SS-3]|nr:hypothetical protein PLICRDRAFT_409906 [Plicaturopsis crispa FD-325 SS-3]